MDAEEPKPRLPPAGEEFERSKDVFQRALDLPAPERAGFLAAECDGDFDLQREVESLLLALDDAAKNREPRMPPAGEQKGDRIDRYELLQRIGTGGFGTVWMAEQLEPVRRKVALKVLKPGMDTDEVVARFEAERQALALMDDPNIAQVFDGGATPGGRPYFVMELVRGVPITDYCDQAQLDVDERLELFQSVCRAVQHAHMKGVIHRDLKPGNVLVTLHDGRPVVKVIDFGIAKATHGELTDKKLFTEFRQMLGTPEYMAPEQAEMSGLDVDTRADVYSLGVLLYELLTGTRPFDVKELLQHGHNELVRWIVEVEPPKPSTRVSSLGERVVEVARQRHAQPRVLPGLLRGDLDWIVMKALEKDRRRRYDTPVALAEDVGRHLRDETVSAGRPSRAHRLLKYVRRHRIGVAAGALIFASLAAGLVAAALGLREAHAQAALARLAEADAITEREAAEQSEQEARSQEQRAQAVTKFLIDVVSSPDPGKVKRPDYTVRELLDDIARQLDDQLAGDPCVESTVRALIGGIYVNLGLPADAEPHLRAALSHSEEAHGADAPQYAIALGDWSRYLYELGDYVAAERITRAALAVWDLRPNADARSVNLDRLNLSELWRQLGRLDDAEEIARRVLGGGDERLVSKACTKIGWVYEERGDWQAAEHWLSRALEAQLRSGEVSHPGAARGNLAHTLYQQGRHEEAETLGREALQLARDKMGDVHPVTFELFNWLAVFLEAQHKYDEALALRREVLAICRRRFGEDHANTMLVSIRLAQLLHKRDELDEAESLCSGVVERARAVLGADDELVGHALFELGVIYNLRDQQDESERCYRAALEVKRRGPVNAGLATTLNNLSAHAVDSGAYEEAIALGEEGLTIRRALLGRAHPDPDLEAPLHNLVVSYCNSGRPAEAVEAARELVGLRRELYGSEDTRVAKALFELAINAERVDDYEEARRSWEESLAIRRRVLGLCAAPTVQSALQLSYLYKKERDYSGGERFTRSLVQGVREAADADRIQLARALEALGTHLLCQEKWREAEQPLQEGIEILSAQSPDHPARYSAIRSLGVALLRQQRFEEAEPLFREGFEHLQPDSPLRRSTIKWLIEVYEGLARPADASAWRARLDGERN